MAAEGGKKKNDATGPIVVIAIGFILLLLFGGCGSISLPISGPGGWNWGNNGWNNGGNHGSHSSHSNWCDQRRFDCRGHWDGNGHWVRNPGADDDDRRHHRHHRPSPTDDPDGGDDNGN